MKTLVNFRFIYFASILLMPLFVIAQTDKKAAEIAKLETAVNNAKAKVALNEKQLADADSMLNLGTQMVAESKAEVKAIGVERKQLDKEYAANRKPLAKQSTSKDKEEATKAKADLKALDTQYKTDSKALDTRLKDATKKGTTGSSNIEKGKANKKKAETSLKASQASLYAATEKYEAATGTGDEEPAEKGKKKK